MTDGTGILGGLRRLLGLPFRLVGRAFGYLIASVLLLAVPVVLLAATTAVWYLPFVLVESTVGLPGGTVGLLEAVGVPPVVAGVPLLYPLAAGAVTSLLLGWPDPDYDGDFDPPLLRG